MLLESSLKRRNKRRQQQRQRQRQQPPLRGGCIDFVMPTWDGISPVKSCWWDGWFPNNNPTEQPQPQGPPQFMLHPLPFTAPNHTRSSPTTTMSWTRPHHGNSSLRNEIQQGPRRQQQVPLCRPPTATTHHRRRLPTPLSYPLPRWIPDSCGISSLPHTCGNTHGDRRPTCGCGLDPQWFGPINRFNGSTRSTFPSRPSTTRTCRRPTTTTMTTTGGPSFKFGA